MDTEDVSPNSQASPTAENPVVAAGKKVKLILSTHQRPSVRILREAPSNEVLRSALEPGPSEGNAIGRRFSIKSLLSRREDIAPGESNHDEYDPDTVDLLDVVGKNTALQCHCKPTDVVQTQKYPPFLRSPMSKIRSLFLNSGDL